MHKQFRVVIEAQEDFAKFKGNFAPIQIHDLFEKFYIIETFPGSHRNLPFIFLDGQHDGYLGIVLARQSSDFLVALAKKMIRYLKNQIKERPGLEKVMEKVSIMQYRLPGEEASLKLILFIPWKDPQQFVPLVEELDFVQGAFIKKLADIANVW